MAQSQRPLAILVRPTGLEPRPTRDRRAVFLGRAALRRSRQWRHRVVCPRHHGARGVARATGLSRVRGVGLAHHRVARWPETGRAPRWLHPILLRAETRAARSTPAAPRARGRHAPPLQARGKTGLRESAGDVADRVSRGARQRSAGVRALHTACRPRGCRRRREAPGPCPARAHAAARVHESRRRSRSHTRHPPRREDCPSRHPAARGAPLDARRSVPARGRCAGERCGARRGPGENLFRHADDRRRDRTRDVEPLRRAQWHAHLSAARARPGLPPAGLLHVSIGQRAARRDPARPPDRPERSPGAREDRVAPQALLGRSPGRTHHGRRAELVGSARFRGVPRARHCAARHDPTRLVEDNSVCCGSGHTETDLNTWHDYLPGWRWETRDQLVGDSTFRGSTWNFRSEWRQAGQPMCNSEFGNVWGYEGSTGDVDWSWDYHRAIDAFRRHPGICGWLYTEHHDVINEWNGYWRYDRSWKETGFGDLVPGMSLRDLHAPLYIAVGDPELSRTVGPGEHVDVPLYASFLSGSTKFGDSLTLRAELYGWNALGERHTWDTAAPRVPYRPWMSRALAPLAVTMPNGPATVVLATRLVDAKDSVLQRNFTTFVVEGPLAYNPKVRGARVPATAVRDAHWPLKQWTVLGDRKLNGAGSGFFEYEIPWPAGLDVNDVASATFLVEASAKRLNGKDRDSTISENGDYMRGGGFHDPSRNPNSYPMTGATAFRSAVTVRVNGQPAGRWDLPDDPADSRGILSWHAQPHDGHLYEAGSYGELLHVPIPATSIREGARSGAMIVRLEVDAALPGGLAIYGARFGRYPIDPSVVFALRDTMKHSPF